MSELRILALDCATKTGWATNCPSGFLESGVQEFALRRGSSPGMRFVEFRLWLEEQLRRLQPEVVVYEQAHHRGGAATELCVGFTTRIQEACARAGIEYRGCHTGTLKRHATGNGAASKEEMIAVAEAYLAAYDPGRSVQDDNEADAVMLLAWAVDGFPELAPAKRSRRRKRGER